MVDEDELLRAALAPPDRAPDRIFADALTGEILIEDRLRAARRLAWRRFAIELAATGGVTAAGAMAVASLSTDLSGMLVLMLLASWVVIVRPPVMAFR